MESTLVRCQIDKSNEIGGVAVDEYRNVVVAWVAMPSIEAAPLHAKPK